ncbi:MAG: ATP-binding cassette domain-containing protein [Clostridiales bacterium]|nr:ATP-binding cassette domain-containing protein [Clostridiales bacterium]
MIRVSHLSKSFNGLKAVDDISLEVKKGEIFGFLGPNGAGKTTTISMIAGLLKPDAGEIFIDSLNLESGLKKIKKSWVLFPRTWPFMRTFRPGKTSFSGESFRA